MSGRRGTFNWATAPDEGDAATAAREIAGWQSEPRRTRDWEALLPQIRDHLSRIVAHPLVRRDPNCRAILASLRPDGGAAALDEAMALISARLDILLRAAPHAGAASAAPRPAPPPADRPAAPPRRRLFRL